MRSLIAKTGQLVRLPGRIFIPFVFGGTKDLANRAQVGFMRLRFPARTTRLRYCAFEAIKRAQLFY